MQPISLFYNPCARSSKLRRIEQWISKHEGAFHVVESESPEHMYKLVKAQVEMGARSVAVAGGDGTLRMAVEALLGTDTALAVVPSGTVNVFARELGIFDPSFSKAWQAIEQGYVRQVDVFLANGIPFVQIGGVGLDARAIELTTRELKGHFGPFAYVISGLKALFEKQLKLTITTTNEEVYHGIAAIFGNGACYGGSMRIFRDADNNDGILDMVVFPKSAYNLLKQTVLAILKGGFSQVKPRGVIYVTLTGATIEAEMPIPYELDGDLVGHTPLTLTKSPHKLNVFALPEVLL